MKLYKYTLEQLKEAVKLSSSIRQTLERLNVIPAGGNYKTFHKAVNHFNIDISHFTGADFTGRKFPKRRQKIEKYLYKGSTINSSTLRIYLLEDKIFEHKCYKCNLSVWNDLPIPLELEHINGINNDNRLENLTLLCPNCHAQTDTYRGKNIRKKSKPKLKIMKNNCKICNNNCEFKYCSSECVHKSQQKIEWSEEFVKILLTKHKGNLTQASKEIGVSDNGIRKWCKKYNLNIKSFK